MWLCIHITITKETESAVESIEVVGKSCMLDILFTDVIISKSILKEKEKMYI